MRLSHPWTRHPVLPVASAADRSASYRFLSRLFLSDPDHSLLRALRGDDGLELLRPALTGAGSDFATEGLGEISSFIGKRAGLSLESLRTELSVQRTRLFRGIAAGLGPPPPYEALHRSREGVPEADLLLEVQRCYLEAGASVPEGCAERPDYLGLELELMAFLCDEEQSSSVSGDNGNEEEARVQQKRFLEEHLLRWVPGYCRMLAPNGGFYGGVVKILAGLLASEAALFGIK